MSSNGAGIPASAQRHLCLQMRVSSSIELVVPDVELAVEHGLPLEGTTAKVLVIVLTRDVVTIAGGRRGYRLCGHGEDEECVGEKRCPKWRLPLRRCPRGIFEEICKTAANSQSENQTHIARDHNFHIKSTKLKQLNKAFNISTVCKPPPLPVITTLVCDKFNDDVNQGNGPDAMKTFLAIDISSSSGVFQELHCDGHEKLVSAALKMGPIGISIYGFRDKASGIVCTLEAVPDARQSVVVGHLYLDLVEEFGAFPLQVTVEKGSETGEMYASHTALREMYTPELDPLQWPVFVALKGMSNIPIENLWKWLQNDRLLEYHSRSRTRGYTPPRGIYATTLCMETHSAMKHCICTIVLKLNEFKDYWNYHKTHRNDKKNLPSGTSPIEIFRNLDAYGLARLSNPVEPAVIDALQENLQYTHKEALWWVPDDFETAAQEVYEAIGSPTLEPRRGWEISSIMTQKVD
ncbi:hypothetical protein B0H10DRAFT_1961177 [Mycena sp. CBHHK59/15]|nr:hypothetical protein B0H10DRAFT_1961177 [Mycena sp. CBHHK59/15]